MAGACGGLLNAAAMVIAHDISSLYDSSLETMRITCRLCNVMLTRSRAVEDTSDSWGWSIVGVRSKNLQILLDEFHERQVSSAFHLDSMSKLNAPVEPLLTRYILRIEYSNTQESKDRCFRAGGGVAHRNWAAIRSTTILLLSKVEGPAQAEAQGQLPYPRPQ